MDDRRARPGNGGLSYQWRFDGAVLVDGGRIAGSQTAQLHIANAQPSDAGLYDVEVSNAMRSVDSTPETLTVVTPVGVAPAPPAVTRFAGVWPVPVHEQASFQFDLAHAGRVSLRLYDVSGRMIRTVLDESRPAGHYEIPWAVAGAAARSAGVYFARFEADGVKVTRRVVLAP